MQKEKAICQNPECGKIFFKQKKINVFCSRKCFKKAYYHRMKSKLSESKYPVYRCPKCHNSVQLDFDPAKRWSPWLSFKCPMCNVLMINVSDSIDITEKTTA